MQDLNCKQTEGRKSLIANFHNNVMTKKMYNLHDANIKQSTTKSLFNELEVFQKCRI